MIPRLLTFAASTCLATLLFIWSYADALPFNYLTLEQLLLDTYEAAALLGDERAMLFRKHCLLVSYFAGVSIFAMGAKSCSAIWLTGAAGGFFLLLPFNVPWVLSAENSSITALFFLLWLFVLAAARLFGDRLSDSAWPLGSLLLVASIYVAVQNTAAVTLRSNPPLQVLAWLASGDRSPRVQLAGARHYLSIGGVEEAVVHLSNAGRSLDGHFTNSSDTELRAAADRLAALAESNSE